MAGARCPATPPAGRPISSRTTSTRTSPHSSQSSRIATDHAVGARAEVLVDGGVQSGADVVAAVALGAKACLVGRAYLYGLMAGGERGVQRAVDILTSEITRTMQLLGTDSVSSLKPAHVRLRP